MDQGEEDQQSYDIDRGYFLGKREESSQDSGSKKPPSERETKQSLIKSELKEEYTTNVRTSGPQEWLNALEERNSTPGMMSLHFGQMKTPNKPVPGHLGVHNDRVMTSSNTPSRRLASNLESQSQKFGLITSMNFGTSSIYSNQGSRNGSFDEPPNQLLSKLSLLLEQQKQITRAILNYNTRTQVELSQLTKEIARVS